MTRRPINYHGKTYYPTQADGCALCEFFDKSNGHVCNSFRDAQTDLIKDDGVCWNELTEGVIWRTGESAQIQHLTERLTT